MSVQLRTDDEIVAAIAAYHAEFGFAPSMRELGTRLSLSVSVIHRRLARLAERGRISMGPPHIGRSLRVIEQDTNATN